LRFGWYFTVLSWPYIVTLVSAQYSMDTELWIGETIIVWIWHIYVIRNDSVCTWFYITWIPTLVTNVQNVLSSDSMHILACSTPSVSVIHCTDVSNGIGK
jgi:hypothetical protein